MLMMRRGKNIDGPPKEATDPNRRSYGAKSELSMAGVKQKRKGRPVGRPAPFTEAPGECD